MAADGFPSIADIATREVDASSQNDLPFASFSEKNQFKAEVKLVSEIISIKNGMTAPAIGTNLP